MRKRMNHSIIDRTEAVMRCIHLFENRSTEGLSERDKRIEENLLLVISIAAQYQRQGLEMEDLIGYGTIGLVEAANSYDPSLGVRFASYAYRWIHKEICNGLTEVGHIVRLPDYIRKYAKKVYRAKEKFLATNGREPTISELSIKLSLNEEVVEAIIAQTSPLESLDRIVGEGDEKSSLAELLPSESDNTDEQIDQREKVLEIMQGLNERERAVLTRHYVQDEDFATIGHAMGLTAERIRQIERKVIRRFQKH